MMRFDRHGPLLALALLSTACVSVPTGPGVMVLPGSGKSFQQFQVDDASCRNWAALQTGTTTQQAAVASGVGSAAVGTAVGAAAGAAIGAAAGAPGTGAAAGAGTGLLLGSAVGADRAWGAASEIQRRYDVAYMQCMYSKGNQIPVAGQVARQRTAPPPRAAGSRRSPPPPPLGPPPPPPPGVY